ncbi:MAG: UDP-N-acetylmuramoyl-L-alanyl-D-glutamate--2,6-diaminopimelate ligase [Planctomycetaceae bacterium]
MEVRSISLRASLGAVSFVGTGDIVASQFCCDSRLVQPGDVFVALRGSGSDGHHHLEAAIAGGAVSVIVNRPSSHINVPQCVVADTRAAFARICLERLGAPQRSINVTGVTGTNGKTTTTWLLRSVLETSGRTTGLLGTLEYSDGRTTEPASLTTPDSQQIAQFLGQMARNRVTDCVMEISSHALHQQRCAGITLAAAAITNITQDHFDYHGDAEQYRAAKLRIVSLLACDKPFLLGIDDSGCQAIRKHLIAHRNVITFGYSSDANLRVETISCSQTGQSLRLLLDSAAIEIRTALVGRHNALNLLAAAALAEQSGVAASDIRDGLERVLEVPGRMERIHAGQPFAVFVDYAHTPDGIAHCVATARRLTSGKVILAFGAGGDRDRHKRPLMAQAAQDADEIIVTSDNPRSESPDQIIADILAGFDSNARVLTCVDRQQGIREALRRAQPGDVVVIAGRGHEKTQQVGDRQISFDDRRVTRRLLLELQTGLNPLSALPRRAIPA